MSTLVSQARSAGVHTPTDADGTTSPVRRKADRSGGSALPEGLKGGIESLSGMSMDHVQVHYNSPQAAQLQSHAFAQGSDIHVAPGQERHLPHEAWHVVQQAQGRVKPTMKVNGDVPVNDDRGLESEADTMGAKALATSAAPSQAGLVAGGVAGQGTAAQLVATTVAQRKLNMVAGYTEALNWSQEAQELIETYEKFEELHDTLKDLMATPAFAKKRKNRLKPLTEFRTALESASIPNDAAKRMDKTAQIEAKIVLAEQLLVDVHAVRGTTAPKEDQDVEGDAENDGTIYSHGEREAASEGEGDAGSVREAAATLLEQGSNLVPTGPVVEEAEADKSRAEQVREMLSGINIKIYDIDKELINMKGRAGELTAETSGGISGNVADGIQAEAKIEMTALLGKSMETTVDVLTLPGMSARAHVEGTVGAKAEGSLEAGASYNEEGIKGGLKGKASAFAGGSVSISPQIRFLSSSNAQMAQLTATGGITYGAGGSYEGEISWEGGRLKISSKGKLAAGLGFEFGLSGEVDFFAPWRD